MTNYQPFILFVLGGPGAGKGTQCTRLVADFNFVHLSAGDLLREEMAREGSEFSELIGKCIKEGSVVPVEVTLALLKAAMERTPDQPFLIDGYPRAMSQAEEFEKQITTCKAVLYFKCTEAAMRERLLNRGKSSGRTDDNEESIVKRFVTFKETSFPVIEHYQERNLVIEIDTEDTPDNVYKVTHDAVAKLLNKEQVSDQVDASAEIVKEEEASPGETKKSKKKNKKKKNKGSVSSQLKPSDNETDKENTILAPVPLTAEISKPIETIKEVETEPAPVESIAPSTEDVMSQPEPSTIVSLENDKPSDAEIKENSTSEVTESKEVFAPVVLEQKPVADDKLADSRLVDPVVAAEPEKEIAISAPTESLNKEEELTEVIDDQVQEPIKPKVTPAEIPQNVFTPDIPIGVDQSLNNIISKEEQKSDSTNNPVLSEELATKPKEITSEASIPTIPPVSVVPEEPIVKLGALVNKVEKSVEPLSTSAIPEDSVAHVEPIAQDIAEKFEESFTIPAIPTELEIKQVETAQELVKEHGNSDILKDIPSQSEAITSKLESVPAIPEEVEAKSDNFLGSFADQIQFSDFKAPDTAFNLPSFNVSTSKSDLEEKANTLEQTIIPAEPTPTPVTEKVPAHFEPSLEAIKNLSPVNVSSVITDLPASVDENQKQAETAITTEIKSIQDKVESQVAPTSETVQQVMSSQPEAIQSSLVKELPTEVTLPISASITELEKINNPEVSAKETVTDVNSQINDQVTAIKSSVIDQASTVNSSVTDQVSAINSSITDQLSSAKLPESTPVNEDSIPKLPTPATLSEKVRDIPLPVPDSPASSATPDRSGKSKSKKKSTCSIM